MKLIEKQFLFAENLARLITHTLHETALDHDCKIQIRLAEGYVGDSINKASEDTPHLRYGTHFLRIGQDLILHIDNIMIDRVEQHPKAIAVYEDIMAYWESLNEFNRAGGRWRKKDYAHFSMEHNGVA